MGSKAVDQVANVTKVSCTNLTISGKSKVQMQCNYTSHVIANIYLYIYFMKVKQSGTITLVTLMAMIRLFQKIEDFS